jgi:hypothetical protein
MGTRGRIAERCQSSIALGTRIARLALPDGTTRHPCQQAPAPSTHAWNRTLEPHCGVRTPCCTHLGGHTHLTTAVVVALTMPTAPPSLQRWQQQQREQNTVRQVQRQQQDANFATHTIARTFWRRAALCHKHLQVLEAGVSHTAVQ